MEAIIEKLNPDITRRLEINLTDIDWQLLAVLDKKQNVEGVIYQLINKAQMGVYRPGSSERSWLHLAFGDEWTDRLEPGDPFREQGGEEIFQRPKRRPQDNPHRIPRPRPVYRIPREDLADIFSRSLRKAAKR